MRGELSKNRKSEARPAPVRSGLIQCAFDSIEDLCETIETWDVDLAPLGAKCERGPAGTILQTGSLTCQYMYASFSVGLSMSGGPPPGLITFNVQEPSDRHYWWRGHDLDASMAWVFPDGGELRSASAPGFQVHTLSVTEEHVARIAADCGVQLLPRSVRPEVYFVPPDTLTHVRTLMQSMRHASGLLPEHQVDRVLRYLVPLWLTRPGQSTRPRPSAAARNRAIAKGLAFIDEYDQQQLDVDTLLKVCHVSERTLQYAFRDFLGMSPAAYIKAQRLVRVRAALRSADPEESTVGEIAATLGFWHLGQFSVDYRRRFGETPSQTLSRPS